MFEFAPLKKWITKQQHEQQLTRRRGRGTGSASNRDSAVEPFDLKYSQETALECEQDWDAETAETDSAFTPDTIIDFITVLPPELSTQILIYLSPTSFNTVNRCYHSLSLSSPIWRNHFIRVFGAIPPALLKQTHGWIDLFKRRRRLACNWRDGIVTNATYLEGHSDAVYTLQFDKKRIITGSRDQTIKIWRKNDDTVASTKGKFNSDTVSSVNYVYQTPSKRGYTCNQTLRGHAGSVLCLAYNSNHIISGSSDTSIRIWTNPEEGSSSEEPTCICILYGHRQPVLDVAFYGTDKVVSCSKDNTIRVWGIASGQCIGLLEGHTSAVNSVCVVNDTLVSASGDSSIRVWDLLSQTTTQILNGHERGLACVEFDGNMIISGSNDQTVRVWVREKSSLGLFVCKRVLRGHTDLVRTLAFDGNRLVTGGYDQTIKVWTLEDVEEEIDSGAYGNGAVVLATSPAGDTEILDFPSNSRNHHAKNSKNLMVDMIHAHSSWVFQVQLDGRRIVSGGQDCRVGVWEYGGQEDDYIHGGKMDPRQQIVVQLINPTNMKDALQLIAEVKEKEPQNLMAKHFDQSYYDGLSPEMQIRLILICRSGYENPDSRIGLFAMACEDYDIFHYFFEKVMREYHGIHGRIGHKTNWDLVHYRSRVNDLGCIDGKLDLKKLGLDQASIKVRISRNLSSFPLCGAMTKANWQALENTLLTAFKRLMADKGFGGTYYSLTPGSPYLINDKEYLNLVKENRIFNKEIFKNDKYLEHAGISSHLPYGRGCYVSADKGFIVWVGESDHLKLICIKKGAVLNDVFDRLRTASAVLEKYADKFAYSKTFGFVTSDPAEAGTGLRASVQLKLPRLFSDDSPTRAIKAITEAKLKVDLKRCKENQSEKLIEISPSKRFMTDEASIIIDLYEAVKVLTKAEEKQVFSSPPASIPSAMAKDAPAVVQATKSPKAVVARPWSFDELAFSSLLAASATLWIYLIKS